MNKISMFFCLLLVIACQQKKENLMPKPTESTFVKMDMEDGSHRGERQLWLEKIHGGKNSDWQTTEYENTLRLLEYKKSLQNPNRDGEEWLADGKLYGKWIERGSNNQAGSALNAHYDEQEDVLYALGAGGPLFKSGIKGYNWELINDDFRFDGAVLEMITLPNNQKRLIASINGIPHYSEDFGYTWTKSTGVTSTAEGREAHTCFVVDNTIFFLGRRDWWSNFTLYKSTDGATYTSIKSLNTSDGGKVELNKATDGKTIYAIERINVDNARISRYNPLTNKLDVITNPSPIAFKDNGKVNLDVVVSATDTILYSYNHEDRLHKSIDNGQTWEYVSQLISTPWGVGLFIPPSNPTKMFTGEVDCFRASNSGRTWNRINHWYEYYGDVPNKLHADIMFMKEFKNQEGEDIVVIGHHGGISITKDYGETTQNITLYDFNVSQYYDVKTHPKDVNLIFAGAQDQGMQRGRAAGETTAEFLQMVSGDYGHITFTGDSEHMWIMYPGGSISYYKTPRTSGGGDFGYEIQYGRESVWIPPVMASPNPEEDVVYVAGGSANENQTGSYIIKMQALEDRIIAENLPFNFSAASGGTVSAMAVSPFDKNIWYVAIDNGRIYKSTDGGINFKQVSNMVSGAHYLYGSCIYPSTTDPNVIYLSGSGYNGIAPVYISTDGGESFAPFKTGMPSTLAFKIVGNEDESKLYAATENGPYVYLMTEEKWFPLVGSTTPNQTYWSVEYINDEKVARFGTYGRGVWDFKDLTIETNTKDEVVSAEIKVYPNPTSDYLSIQSKMSIQSAEIFTTDGKKISTIKNPNDRIPVQHLKSGNYVVILNTDRNKITKTFTKI